MTSRRLPKWFCTMLAATAVLMVGWGMGSAQEQKEAPPLRPLLPPDSVRAPSREQAERAQLELPEVLVYGRDAALRLEGHKLSISTLSLASYELPPERGPVADSATLARREEIGQSWTAEPRSSLLRACVGSFWTTDAEALFRQRRQRISYRGGLAFRRSDGAVENGYYSMLDLAGRMAYQFSSRGTVRAHVAVSQQGYGLPRATLPDTTNPVQAERHNSDIGVGAEVEMKTGHQGQFVAWYEFSAFRSSDDTLRARFSHVAAGTHRVGTKFSLRLAGIDLTSQVSYLHEGYRPPDGSGPQENALARVELGVGRGIMARAQAHLGVGLDNISCHGRRSSTLAFWGRVALPVTPRAGLLLEVRRGYDYRQLSDHRAENPYFSPWLQLNPVLTKCAVAIDANWRLSRGLVCGVRVTRSWLQDQWYWQRDPATGLFGLAPVPKLKVNRAVITVRGQPFSRLSIEARYIVCHDSFHLAGAPRGADVPYLAHRHLPVTLTYHLGDRTRVELRSDAMSSRTAEMRTQERLGPYALFSCAATHRLSNRVSVFVQGQNLTNRRYQRWQGFREMGLALLAGAFASW